MNNIQTAEEFLNNFRFEAGKVIGNRDFDIMALYAREFAKLHVEAALQAAAETQYPSSKANFELVNEKILNAYPLKNIK